MNQATQSFAAPSHIIELRDAVYQQTQEIAAGSLSLLPAEGMNATLFILEGKYVKTNLSVRLSHTEEDEELVTAVFIDSSKPLGKDTLTRHYQPGKYLGKDANGASNSRRFQTSPTRRAREILHLDIFYFLKDGLLPIKSMEEYHVVDAQEA